MRIVVGAATGNTGQHVVRALSKAGQNVVAITRDPEGKVAKELALLAGVEVKKYEEAFNQPIDRAYLACHNFRDQFLDETDFIIAARRAGVKYIVKLSTFEPWMQIYSDPYYARSHLAVEFFLEHGDIPFTCLRANLFFNWLGVDFESVPKTKQFRTALGSGSVASIDPADIGLAAAKLLLLEDPSPHIRKKYMLVGPEDVNDESIKRDFSEVLGTAIQFGGTYTNDELKASFLANEYPEKSVKSMLVGPADLSTGSGDRAHTKTSPEILALAPPTTTFRDYIKRYYSK